MAPSEDERDVRGLGRVKRGPQGHGRDGPLQRGHDTDGSEQGWITGADGGPMGTAGIISNCPLIMSW